MPRERRIAFVNGLGTGVMGATLISTLVGYHLAATLPPLFGAAVLFLTPISFLLTSGANSACWWIGWRWGSASACCR